MTRINILATVGIYLLGISTMGGCQTKEMGSVPVLSVFVAETTLPPYHEETTADVLVSFSAAVFGQLLRVDSFGNLLPGHVESWRWIPDEMSYELRLKEGLRFGDERPVTIEDLEYSLLRGFFSRRSNFYHIWMRDVSGIETLVGKKFRTGVCPSIRIVNERTLRVKLRSENPNFLYALTHPFFTLYPQEHLKSDHMTWRTTPVGAGSFKIVQDFNGTSTVIEHKQKGNRLELFSTRPEKNVDLAFSPPPKADLKNYRIHVSSYPDSVFTLLFSSRNSLGRNPEFRKIVASAISRQEIVDGFSYLKPAQRFLPSHFFRDPKNKVVSQEPAELLKKKVSKLTDSGLNLEGIRVSVFGSSNMPEDKKRVLNRIQEQLERVGIKITYLFSEEKFISEDSAKGVTMMFAGIVADMVDPAIMYASLRKDSPFILTRQEKDDNLEKLFQSIYETPDLRQRIKHIVKLDDYVRDQAYLVPLYEFFPRTYVRKSASVSLGNQPQPLTFLFENLEFQQ